MHLLWDFILQDILKPRDIFKTSEYGIEVERDPRRSTTLKENVTFQDSLGIKVVTCGESNCQMVASFMING